MISPAVNLQPLVSCLMVTKNRVDLAKRAMFCFTQQTYVNKELVIIDDGESTELAEYVQQLNHPHITHYHLRNRNLKLGDLRNISIDKATGSYLAQWDDDDLSDPLRLELQMAVIRAFKVDGCLLDNIYIWWPHQQRLAKSFRWTWEGTLVWHRDILPKYPHLQRGEDTEVVKLAIQNHRIGINIAGFVNQGFGISEGTQCCLSALTANQIPHAINQIEVLR